jgi:16S rRNA (adenine1518-N6/adenine1519-N6)-dimethyltransferase
MLNYDSVKAKKSFGQHFLNDDSIAVAIADALPKNEVKMDALEIGPGMGVLTKFLLDRNDLNLSAVELDKESVIYLEQHYPTFKNKIIQGDFLQLNLKAIFPKPFYLVGNFPYNISTQILFAVLENKEHIPAMVGMFQKEVAKRIASGPGNKDYGILSVLLQPWYEIEYLFSVDENKFNPPPKVKSGVLRMIRNERQELGIEESYFKMIVKTGFNQRRKTLRNALRPLLPEDISLIPFLSFRAEALSWEQFVILAKAIQASKTSS